MNNQVTVYGADWCGDTVRAKRHLKNRGVEF
ncbi:MAG: Glutaredoxin, partial [Acidobacteriota bacterium]|nr:Glutaredoxin [Acidobacteriota bacterium]